MFAGALAIALCLLAPATFTGIGDEPEQVDIAAEDESSRSGLLIDPGLFAGRGAERAQPMSSRWGIDLFSDSTRATSLQVAERRAAAREAGLSELFVDPFLAPGFDARDRLASDAYEAGLFSSPVRARLQQAQSTVPEAGNGLGGLAMVAAGGAAAVALIGGRAWWSKSRNRK